jgi:hypothetical protein
MVALFALHIGGDRPEQGRLRLVGAVRTAKALNRRIGFPAGFEHIMHALSLVTAEIRWLEKRCLLLSKAVNITGENKTLNGQAKAAAKSAS